MGDAERLDALEAGGPETLTIFNEWRGGVGLSLAHRITALHGGRLTAASEGAGKGSRFVLQLPRLHLSQAATAKPMQADGLALRDAPRFDRPLRVLIVDDNVDAAESMAMLLQLDGHEVLVRHDGDRIVERALAFRPDVALLDIGLPGRSGFDLAIDLRGSPQLEGLKLIAVTGYGQDEDRRRSQESGFHHHLMTGRHQLANTGWRQRNTVLTVLHFTRHTDQHGPPRRG